MAAGLIQNAARQIPAALLQIVIIVVLINLMAKYWATMALVVKIWFVHNIFFCVSFCVLAFLIPKRQVLYLCFFTPTLHFVGCLDIWLDECPYPQAVFQCIALCIVLVGINVMRKLAAKLLNINTRTIRPTPFQICIWVCSVLSACVNAAVSSRILQIIGLIILSLFLGNLYYWHTWHNLKVDKAFEEASAGSAVAVAPSSSASSASTTGAAKRVLSSVVSLKAPATKLERTRRKLQRNMSYGVMVAGTTVLFGCALMNPIWQKDRLSWICGQREGYLNNVVVARIWINFGTAVLFHFVVWHTMISFTTGKKRRRFSLSSKRSAGQSGRQPEEASVVSSPVAESSSVSSPMP